MKKNTLAEWKEYPDYYKQIIVDPSIDKEVNFLMQKVRLKPKTEAQNHYHKNQIEIFIGVKNKGYFIVDGERINLVAGETLRVPKNKKHTVGNDNEEEFEFIAIKLNYSETDTYTD